MASRGGTRALGTDGSDFTHREIVASHYQTSLKYKSRMKITLFCHFFLFLLMSAKVAFELLRTEEVQERYDTEDIQEREHPENRSEPLIWEYIWLCGIVFALTSYIGLSKNKVNLMRFSVWGIFIFCVIPSVAAAVCHVNDVIAYIWDNSDGKVKLFQGVPACAIWYLFIAIAFQVHMLSVVFALKLIKAWTPRRSKKNK